MLKRHLKSLLEKRGTTAAELARKTGVPKQTISDWLSGTTPRNMDYVRRVAAELGVRVEHLVFGDPAQSTLVPDPMTPDHFSGDGAGIHRYFHFFFENSIALDRIVDLRTGLPRALSQSWEKTLGWPREDLMKTKWLELIHPHDRDQITAATAVEDEARTTQSSFEHRLLTAAGPYIRVHTRLVVDHKARLMASISLPIETVVLFRHEVP